jgi:integrase
MFVHPSGGRWGKSQQSRPMSQATARADIEVPITFHGLRHTYASHAVTNGVPLLVIAQNLGHKDTRMVEKHYGHLANSYMRETLRNSGPRWELGDQSNVVSLH